MSLQGKVAIITGSTRGIGRATALRLAQDGASIVLNSTRDTAGGEALVKEIGADRAAYLQADCSTVDGVQSLVERAVARFGKIDIVVANAGISKMADLEATTEKDFDLSFNLNVKGVYFLAQAAVPHMAAGSRVILLSTGVNSWTDVVPHYLLYTATKGAIDQMTRVMAKDLARKGINVNAVAPGPTATELFFKGKTDAVIDHIKAGSPFNRLGKPEEIAGAIAFLCSDSSSWVAGQTIRVNGAMMV